MPYQIIKTKEYACTRCGYKWIARKNGVEKPKPGFCPKCKTWLWDRKATTEVVPAEGFEPSKEFIVRCKEETAKLQRYRLRNSS